MKWWKSDVIQTSQSSYGHRLIYSLKKDAELQYEAEIGTASLVNAGLLHSSCNPTEERRLVVALSLFYWDGARVLWDDALKILKDYILE